MTSLCFKTVVVFLTNIILISTYVLLIVYLIEVYTVGFSPLCYQPCVKSEV